MIEIKTIAGLELRRKLSEVIRRAANGERFKVEMAGVPTVLIVPHGDQKKLEAVTEG